MECIGTKCTGSVQEWHELVCKDPNREKTQETVSKCRETTSCGESLSKLLHMAVHVNCCLCRHRGCSEIDSVLERLLHVFEEILAILDSDTQANEIGADAKVFALSRWDALQHGEKAMRDQLSGQASPGAHNQG